MTIRDTILRMHTSNDGELRTYTTKSVQVANTVFEKTPLLLSQGSLSRGVVCANVHACVHAFWVRPGQHSLRKNAIALVTMLTQQECGPC